MDDISYARKYRPKSLDDYVGNEKVVERVRRVLANEKKPQGILIKGHTGCGKTTIARIIESWYMCENPNEDGSPCGECFSCQAFKEYIEKGTSDGITDVNEIDVTDKSGKSDMDALLEEVEYPSYSGGWKIYLFDEAHRMSFAAASRLLKVLEEPPEKVLFIFCTTDPDKMLDTIKNRCLLKLEVVKPRMNDVLPLMQRVCLEENKEYDLQGLRMLVTRSDYVIRDCLNNLETVISSRGNAKSVSVAEEFREVSDKLIFDFYESYLTNDFLRYMNVMYEVKTTYDFAQFVSSIMSFTVRGIYILNSVDVEGLSSDELREYVKLFKRFTPNELSYVLSSLKRMLHGDIEANLMAFIYCKNREWVDDGANSVEKTDKGGQLDSEKSFRNDNVKKLEQAKLAEGKDFLSSNMKKVGFDDISSMFNLERVNR